MRSHGDVLKAIGVVVAYLVLLSACGIPFHTDLYALAAAPIAPYTIVYNGNGNDGGTVPTDSNTYAAGAAVTVAGAGAMVKSGYTFTGWNTAADGSGTHRAAGTSMTMGAANVVLYAVWTNLPTYSVSYDGNASGVSGVPTDSNNYLPGATVPVANPGSMARSGYTFTRWNTAADGSSGTNHDGGSSMTMGTASVVLYAVWTVQGPLYNVVYDGNGGTSAPTDSTGHPASSMVTVLSPGSLSLSSNVFGGWNTASDGSGTTYSGGDTFLIGTTNVTLFAMWLSVTGSTITFVPAGATKVVVPEGITSFGFAFNSHPNLTSVTIPSTITTMSLQPFLTVPELATIISNNTRYQVINGALVDTNTEALITVPSKLSGAFAIPAGVTSVNQGAFNQCTNLTSITIPASLTTINGSAFTSLQSVVPITIPASVIAIADYGFSNSGITVIYMDSGTPPLVNDPSTVFSFPYPTIHVPAGAVTAYQTAWASAVAAGVTIVTP